MMQRRLGKAAHISPPRGNGDHDVTEKPSRLDQRTLGLKNRIWIILSFLCAIFFFSRIITIPYDQPPPRYAYSSAHLRPKNYMNASESEPHPFDFCPVFGPGDEIGGKYGVHVLSRTRVHLGSGARVQRVLHKAMLGLPVTISVLGGSVSACHGAGDDPISPKCYPARFFGWWNSVFPHPASELTNGALRRTNSAYFSFCNAHHLPDHTDLVILEFDVDDPHDDAWMQHFERLVRSILVRPDQPAVIILGHFSPQVQQAYGFHGPEVLHSVVAQFYDVPHISIKPALYPAWVSSASSVSEYFIDPMLASPEGHELLADVLAAYIQSQVCAAWAAATGTGFDVAAPLRADSAAAVKPPADGPGLFGGIGFRQGPDKPAAEDDGAGVGGAVHAGSDADGGDPGAASPHGAVPAGRISSRPTDPRPPREVQPFCVSAHDLITPLPPSLFDGSGWHAEHPAAGGGGGTAGGTAHYWYATLPTSKLRVPIQTAAGDVGVYYVREPRADVGEGSAVECWVDDNYAGAVVLLNAEDVGQPEPTLEIIDRYVSPGSHFVECQLTGEEGRGVPPFRLLGIFAT